MIPMANPKAQYLSNKVAIDSAIQRVLASGTYINGPEVARFESEFSAYIGTTHGIGVASGTDAIRLAVAACGIGPGDDVITVSHTAVATVAAIELAGARPVLVDVEGSRLTLDPEQIEDAVTPRTKAVVVVHLYGQPAALADIRQRCSRHGLRLIEDCAQAHGATWQGKRVGSIGDVSCFSFYPTKNLGAVGDGGMVITNDPELAQRSRDLREYGWRRRYISETAGMNSRLDELQAAILRVKLAHLDDAIAARRAIARRYDEELEGLDLGLPVTRAEEEHAYHLYVVRTPHRDALREHLKLRDVATGIHYPLAVHMQPAYKDRIHMVGDLPQTEQAVAQVLSLPMFPELEPGEVSRVSEAVREFVCTR